jgi:hypothetical protein
MFPRDRLSEPKDLHSIPSASRRSTRQPATRTCSAPSHPRPTCADRLGAPAAVAPPRAPPRTALGARRTSAKSLRTMRRRGAMPALVTQRHPANMKRTGAGNMKPTSALASVNRPRDRHPSCHRDRLSSARPFASGYLPLVPTSRAGPPRHALVMVAASVVNENGLSR